MHAVDGTRIRSLTSGDLEDALALSSAAGWNQRLEDWRMLLGIAPGGAVAAEEDGRVIGTAIGIDYGGFGWIAMMLVDPGQRGQGLGGRLLEAAMAALPRNRRIRLDATPLGRPLYQRHGFRDETRLHRYVASAAHAAPAPSPSGATTRVRQLGEEDLGVVAAHDAAVFKGNRRSVIAWAAGAAPAYARIVDDAGVPQYCCGRSGRLFDQIGPVAACDEETACELVRAAISSSAGRPLVVDAFDAHERFTAWLRASGFAPQRPLFRMYRPATAGDDRWTASSGSGLREFAILGPEFA